MAIENKVKLNKNQASAVNNIDGPTMVIAGPGTGKTQVLTARIANILASTDSPPDSILALTFTESAVQSMRDRLTKIVGTESYYINIHTFHSFCLDVIRTNPEHFLISSDLEPLSDLERIEIFCEIIDNNEFLDIKPYRAPYFYLKQIQSNIQTLKREGVLTSDFEKILATTKPKIEDKNFEKFNNRNLELLKFYKIYEQTLNKLGRYDFEDMINWVVEKFKTDESLLLDYQERFQYVLVDEYQDTNNAQNEIVNTLISYWGEEANIFIVGDEDQSIYRFQGASLENILNFKEKYNKASIITLIDNYRSGQNILDTARTLITNNSERLEAKIQGINKDLQSQVKTDSKIFIGQFESNISENIYIIEEIKQLLKNKVEPNEIAIIYRNNQDAYDIAELLAKSHISYSTEGGENILFDPQIKMFLKLLNVIKKLETTEDDHDLFHLLNYDFVKLDSTEVLKLLRFASRRHINIFEAINDPNLTKHLSAPTKFINFFEKLKGWYELEKQVSFIEFFETLLNESGFLSYVLKHNNQIRLINKVNTLFDEIKKLSKSDNNLNLEKFLNNLSLLKEHNIQIKENELDLGKSSVVLTTAHKAKGREFEYVYIIKAVDKKWGNKRKSELFKLPQTILKHPDQVENDENEEDRRLFYVALTRAKKQATITYATKYMNEGNVRSVSPSIFVEEIRSETTIQIDNLKAENKVSEYLKTTLTQTPKVDMNSIEKEFLKDTFKKFKLSATSLNTYLKCPYKFKIKEIFKTPQFKDKSLCLGTAVHFALDRFGKEIIKGTTPSLEFVIKRFEDSLAQEILSANDFEETTKHGKKILEYYYKAYENKWVTPLYTELRIGIGSRPLPYLDDDIQIQGVIDKIEPLNEKNEVKIVDYKTGKSRSSNEIEGKTKNSDGSYKRQLIFYKLLCDLDKTFLRKVKEAEIDFVESASVGKPKKVSFTITDEEVNELKIIIKNVMQNIRKFKFGKTTDYSTCKACEFIDHCWPEGLPSGQLSLIET